ncbi:ribonuclease H family protein [Patescibacteria group bacterium]|nr:ribonuclease H family protein [Patescibacteria group bacterium]
MITKTKKYYAYILTDKQKSGVIDNWKECEKIVSGKKARFKSFKSQIEAQNWLKKGGNYEIKKAIKLEKGIYFDSGTGRGNGVEVSVTDETKKNLLNKISPKIKINKFGKHHVVKATNNYGELLACKYALQIAIDQKNKNIFGDSRLVLDYWSKGFISKKLQEKTIKLSKQVSELRKDFESIGGEVKFIKGDHNPADLGFHK